MNRQARRATPVTLSNDAVAADPRRMANARSQTAMYSSPHEAIARDTSRLPEPSMDGSPPATPHPGERLGRELRARGLSSNAFALKLRVPANRISEIVRGRRAISVETALRISRCLGGDPALWLTLQASHDLAVAERSMGGGIDREVDPL